MIQPAIVAIHSWQSDILARLSNIWSDAVNASQPVLAGTVNIVALFANYASRNLNQNFSMTVNGSGVFLINGLAHGDDDAFTGSDGTLYGVPVSLTQQIEIRGKLVHFLSCNTAEILGPALVAAGCRGFLGYTGKVDIDADTGWQQKFVACDAQIDIALASGKSMAEARQAAVQSFAAAGLAQYVSQLQFYGSDDSVSMHDVLGGGPAPNVIASRSIAVHTLAPPNTIAARTI